MIIAKHNTIEIFKIQNGFERQLTEINIFANISYLDVLRSQNLQSPDLIFLITNDMRYSIFEIKKSELISKAEGNLSFDNAEKVPQDLAQFYIH